MSEVQTTAGPPTAESFGTIKQRQSGLISVRVRILCGNALASEMEVLSALAKKYGAGKLHLTVRQSVEIPHVPEEQVDKLKGELAASGFTLGACGPRVRAVTACQGKNVCPHAVGDTELGLRLDKRFYAHGPLPHKFKIAVTGCANACIKPQENDLGFVGVVEPVFDAAECIGCGLCQSVCPAGAIGMVDGLPVIDRSKCDREGKCIRACPAGALKEGGKGWRVFVGGKFGRRPQLGVVLEELLPDEEAVGIAARVLKAFEDLGRKGERLGDLINRIGIEAFKEAVSEA